MTSVRCFDWFGYSHWGMFRLELFTAPDWFAFGVYDETDDDLLEYAPLSPVSPDATLSAGKDGV